MEQPQKQAKTAWKPKEQPQPSTVLHLGSDSEDEVGTSKQQGKVAKDFLHGVTAPLTRLRASQVEDLKFFTVKNADRNIIFYKSPPQSVGTDLSCEEECKIEEAQRLHGYQDNKIVSMM